MQNFHTTPYVHHIRASYTQLEFNKMIGDAELCGDQKVRNLATDMLEEVKAGWAPDAVDIIGKKFFR